MPAPAEPDSRRGFSGTSRDDSSMQRRGIFIEAAVSRRADCGADDPRSLVRAIRDARRRKAARIGDVGLRIVRGGFDEKSLEGLVDRKSPTLTAAQGAAPGRAVEDGPKPRPDGAVRGRLVDPV